jgi:prepilin-type processing-associated H-X9-DG protein
VAHCTFNPLFQNVPDFGHGRHDGGGELLNAAFFDGWW